MRFEFKMKEIRYVQNKFGFQSLLGIEKKSFVFPSPEKDLLASGVLRQDANGQLDLNYEIRYLFTAWEKMRYSVVSLDAPEDDTNEEILLSNEKEILMIVIEGNAVTIDLIDYDIEIMDNILCSVAACDPDVQTSNRFNISVSVDEFSVLHQHHVDQEYSLLNRKLGVPGDVLKAYFDAINREDEGTMILIEDHLAESGSLVKIVNSSIGVCALKHITPAMQENERMIMLMGEAIDIINSLYNL